MRNYLILMNVLLLTGASYLGVSSFYKTVEGKLEVVNPAVSAGQKTTSPSREAFKPLSEYEGIKKRNLFKLVEKKETPTPTPAKVDIEQLQETRLQLRLWGTVTGDIRESYAVIEDTKKKSQQLYHVEDAIQDAIVKEIHREKVILDVGGNLEVLQMEKIQSAGVRRSRRGESFTQSSRRSSRPRDVTLSRSKINEAVNDLNSLMKQVRIRPHYDKGKPDGLTLSGIRSGSIFSEMGFRNGDVLVGVDGQNIQSVDDALSLYQNLQASENVEVQIRRRGRPQTIRYKIK